MRSAFGRSSSSAPMMRTSNGCGSRELLVQAIEHDEPAVHDLARHLPSVQMLADDFGQRLLGSTTRTRFPDVPAGRPEARALPIIDAQLHGEREHAADAELASDLDVPTHQLRRGACKSRGRARFRRDAGPSIRRPARRPRTACGRSASSMPMPLSCTATSQHEARVGARVTVASMKTSPFSVNLMALPTRLLSTCLSRSGSPMA